jgi:prevent-host-death family protein
MKRYQLQDAKAHLSELVAGVVSDGPAVITVHGKAKAALVPMSEYERLYPGLKEPLLDFFRRSPLRGQALKLERDKSPARKVDL